MNWKTTLSGLLAGIPPIVITAAAGAGVHLPPMVNMTLAILSGVGMLLTGLSAKDSTTHSTKEEMIEATIEHVNKIDGAKADGAK